MLCPSPSGFAAYPHLGALVVLYATTTAGFRYSTVQHRDPLAWMPLTIGVENNEPNPSTQRQMAQDKAYIGGGKTVGQYGSVRVTLKMEDVLKHAYKTERGEFITFTVDKLKQANEYGKTHTAYVLLREEKDPTAVAEPAPGGGNVADGAPKRERRLRKK